MRGIEVEEFAIIEKATVYPGQEINFRIADLYVPFPVSNIGDWKKALIRIILEYEGEGIQGKFVETQHLMFSDKTGYEWRIVGADFLRRVKSERGAGSN